MIMSTKEICKRGLSMTISLTLGNTGLPLGNGLPRDAEPLGKRVLREAGLFAAEVYLLVELHGILLLCFISALVYHAARPGGNRPCLAVSQPPVALFARQECS